MAFFKDNGDEVMELGDLPTAIQKSWALAYDPWEYVSAWVSHQNGDRKG